MSNKSEKTYTSRNISNSKWLLAVGTSVAIAIDALIMVLLCIGTYDFKFIAFPCAMLVLDAVYLAVGMFATNYRFKYSIAVWFVYILLTAVFCICGTVILLTLDGTVLTTVALILWLAVHAVSIVCAIFTALYTSKKFKSSVFTIIITLILAALCALYAVFLFGKGFFGQGVGVRTLVYDYNEADDSYTVSAVLSGSSKKVEIEETFNGKPVKAVNCSVFIDNTVKEYVLHDDFELVDTFELANGNVEGKSILVDGEDAIFFRAKLFSCADDAQGRANVLKLANATVPFNLEENKGYIAFDYDEDAYAACGGNVLPIIIGDKGQSLSLTDYASTYEYLNHTDKTIVADLKWGYENCNGYILDSISSDRSYVFGDGANVKVEFEKVYRIYVGSGNDSKYDLRTKQSAFCCDSLNGTALDYRYIAESSAGTFFNDFTAREGFSLVWTYGEDGSGTWREFSSLTEAIDNLNSSALSISPLWTLNAPTVVLNDYTITYGENVTFASNASSPASGISLVYEWRHNNVRVGSSEDLSLTTPSLSGEYDGEYVLTVTTVGGEVTSLVSSVTKSLNLNIAKKTISFGWDMPAEDDRVYSGSAKTVSATFDNSQLIGSDQLTYKLKSNLSSTVECTNAGDYLFEVEIDETSAKNYQIDSTGTNSLTITPFNVEVVWSDYDFTYNGLPQVPTATGLGVDNQPIALRIDGSGTDAYASHTVKAVYMNNNYKLTNDSLTFTIKKAPLTATAKDCTTVYGITPIGQGADFEGFVNNETDFVLNGAIEYSYTNTSNNVGTYVDCVVISGLTSYNYEITFLPGDLIINQRAVTVTWQNATDLTYNGQAQNVTATLNYVVNGDDVTAVVANGNQTDVGIYTAEVTALAGSDAGNYRLSDTYAKDYTIAKASVTITPDSVSAVYGDSEKELTATVSGEIYNGDFNYTLSRETGNTVGSYAITVNLSGETANYDVTSNTGIYKIDKRTVTLTWSGYENLIYDGTAKNVAATLNNAVDGDDVKAEFSGGDATNAGSYTATATLSGAAASNYALPSNYSRTYTIAKAKLTITASNATSVYGENLAQLTANVTSGTNYNDEVNYSVTTTATSTSPVGTYAITVVVGEYSNYVITTEDATYTITQATPALNGFTGGNYILSEELEYGATLGDITAKLPAQTLSGSWVWADGSDKVAEVGTNTYTVTFNPTDAINYKSVTVNVTITVKSAEDPVTVG
ncbi:MAG: MBG domain-containing protein [Candidatus Coproplasma sp.]